MFLIVVKLDFYRNVYDNVLFRVLVLFEFLRWL